MKYGLIGEHLGHSYSKLIQEKLLDNYIYDLNPIPKDEVDAFMKQHDFKAINVTIPYKQTVIPYLFEMDDAAKKIGAVNTIVNKEGNLYGYNTDYYGFRYMVENHNVDLNDKTVLVLGNGGASQAIQAVVQDLNAKKMYVTDIVSSEKVISIETVYQNYCDDIDVVINTTPCGMYPHTDSVACDLNQFKNCQAVFDCVYNPMETRFTREAKQKGIKVAVTGLEMLVAQAKKALEYFKDISIPTSEIDRIYREILSETSNVVLVDTDVKLSEEFANQYGKKLCLPNQEDIDTVAMENKQVILVKDQETLEAHKSMLLSNGFIASGNTTQEIYQSFIQEVKAF